MGLMFFQQFVGINALVSGAVDVLLARKKGANVEAKIYYSPSLFEILGLDSEMQLIMSGVLNICQLVGVLSSLWSMNRFGRRPLLLLGSVLMTIAHLIIAVLVGKFSYDWKSHSTESWVGVAFLLFYMISFGATWDPVCGVPADTSKTAG